MSKTNRSNVQNPPTQEIQELKEREMLAIAGGRRVDDNCYLYYGYYCPSGELKPFGG